MINGQILNCRMFGDKCIQILIDWLFRKENWSNKNVWLKILMDWWSTLNPVMTIVKNQSNHRLMTNATIITTTSSGVINGWTRKKLGWLPAVESSRHHGMYAPARSSTQYWLLSEPSKLGQTWSEPLYNWLKANPICWVLPMNPNKKGNKAMKIEKKGNCSIAKELLFLGRNPT